MSVGTVQGVRVELLGAPLLGPFDAYATPPESIDGEIEAVLDPIVALRVKVREALLASGIEGENVNSFPTSGGDGFPVPA